MRRSSADDEVTKSGYDLLRGYQPGVLGRLVEMHGAYYSREHGLDPSFEAEVATQVGAFATRLHRASNGMLAITQADRMVGTIAIDGEGLRTGCARLRWFIVEDAARGSGAGSVLIQEALNFCDQFGFAEAELWTFRGLDAARRLYEAHGFRLVEERPGVRWGRSIIEQRFVRQSRVPANVEIFPS